MGRATEYIAMINAKKLPSKSEIITRFPSLGESDVEVIKKIRKEVS